MSPENALLDLKTSRPASDRPLKDLAFAKPRSDAGAFDTLMQQRLADDSRRTVPTAEADRQRAVERPEARRPPERAERKQPVERESRTERADARSESRDKKEVSRQSESGQDEPMRAKGESAEERVEGSATGENSDAQEKKAQDGEGEVAQQGMSADGGRTAEGAAGSGEDALTLAPGDGEKVVGALMPGTEEAGKEEGSAGLEAGLDGGLGGLAAATAGTSNASVEAARGQKDEGGLSRTGSGSQSLTAAAALSGQASADGETAKEGEGKAGDQLPKSPLGLAVAEAARDKSPVSRGAEQVLAAVLPGKEGAAVPSPGVNPLSAPGSTFQLLPGTSGQSVAFATLQSPVGSPQFGDEFVQQMGIMASRNLKSAQLLLNPAELGPMEIKIVMHKDQAQIQVQAATPLVRDLVEGSQQRLRDMLASQGIELSQFDVGSRQSHRDQTGGERHAGGQGSGREGEPGSSLSGEPLETRRIVGIQRLVDYYA